MAQVIFFVSAAIAALWSITSRGEWLVGHLIGVSITGQICTLFCLAWFLSKLRGVQEQLRDSELLIIKSRQVQEPVRKAVLPPAESESAGTRESLAGFAGSRWRST